jgi:hypothetical protein
MYRSENDGSQTLHLPFLIKRGSLMDEKNQQNLDINIADRNKNRTKLKNQE